MAQLLCRTACSNAWQPCWWRSFSQFLCTSVHLQKWVCFCSMASGSLRLSLDKPLWMYLGKIPAWGWAAEQVFYWEHLCLFPPLSLLLPCVTLRRLSVHKGEQLHLELGEWVCRASTWWRADFPAPFLALSAALFTCDCTDLPTPLFLPAWRTCAFFDADRRQQ